MKSEYRHGVDRRFAPALVICRSDARRLGRFWPQPGDGREHIGPLAAPRGAFCPISILEPDPAPGPEFVSTPGAPIGIETALCWSITGMDRKNVIANRWNRENISEKPAQIVDKKKNGQCQIVNLPVNSLLAVSGQMKPYLLVAASLGIFILVWFLAAMFRREAVKRDLRQHGCKPIRIWWTVIGWWRPYYSIPFRVIYSDRNHFVHKARCWVSPGLMDFPFGPCRVVWVRDEITGRVPPPEVWASDEILRQKLKGRNDLTGKRNLLKNPSESQEP